MNEQSRNGKRLFRDVDGLKVVRYNQLPIVLAQDIVWEATWPHYETVEEARRFYSPLEAELLAGFIYLKEAPLCQWQFGPYRVDFLFREEHVAVEVDGREWHRDYEKQRKRWQYLHDEHDVVVKRVTGSEVYRDPIQAAHNILNHVHWIRDRLHLVRAA